MFVLEQVFKDKKAVHSDAFNLRIHRGLSWFKKATQLDDDLDLKFITLWISFHALYAQELEHLQNQQHLSQFLQTMLQHDVDHKIEIILLERSSQPIYRLLNSSYSMQSYWDYQNQAISLEAYKAQRGHEKKKVTEAIENKHTEDILLILFSRLCTLNDQFMQGGCSYKSALNREQLQDACLVLSALLPALIYILLENADALDNGKPYYPVAQVS